jgi:Flp pilus assembly protein TadD
VAERAYQLAPSDANVADTLGWALVEAGQVEKGLRYLREAQVRAPANPEIRDHLAEALKRRGPTSR